MEVRYAYKWFFRNNKKNVIPPQSYIHLWLLPNSILNASHLDSISNLNPCTRTTTAVAKIRKYAVVFMSFFRCLPQESHLDTPWLITVCFNRRFVNDFYNCLCWSELRIENTNNQNEEVPWSQGHMTFLTSHKQLAYGWIHIVINTL